MKLRIYASSAKSGRVTGYAYVGKIVRSDSSHRPAVQLLSGPVDCIVFEDGPGFVIEPGGVLQPSDTHWLSVTLTSATRRERSILRDRGYQFGRADA